MGEFSVESLFEEPLPERSLLGRSLLGGRLFLGLLLRGLQLFGVAQRITIWVITSVVTRTDLEDSTCEE